MKTFAQIAAEIAPKIKEMMPWDAEEYLEEHPETLIVDIRETHVPRGILENACEWDFEETEPELVKARKKPVLLVCRSGNRTTLAAYTLQQMGYENVISLKTGLRGWSDYELPMVDIEEKPVDLEDADKYFANKILPDQHKPADED